MSNSRPIHRFILIIIILFAFATRVFRLPDASIWWDEGIAVWLARLSIIDMMRWTAVDVHPPFYFGLLHFWRILVGDSEFGVRFLSALIGTLSVVMLWRLGRVLFPKKKEIALLAGIWLALSRFDVWWSQEARMYALGGLLFVLSLYFTWQLRYKPSWFNRLGYLLSTIAALWTLYLLAFTLVIESLFWLWTLRELPRSLRWRRLGEWVIYQMLLLASFMPWLAYSVPRMRTWSVQEPFDASLFFKLYGTLLLVGESVHIERFNMLLILVIILLAMGLMVGWFRQKKQRTRSGVVLLVLALFIPPLAVWFATTVPRSIGYSPKPEARYLLPFALPFYLLAAWAFYSLFALFPRTRWARILVASLIALMLIGQGATLHAYYQGHYLQDDFKSIAATLAAHKQDDDVVFLHTDRSWPVFAFHWPYEFSGWPNGENATENNVDYWLRGLWEDHAGLWLVLDEDALRADKDRLVEDWLRERARAQHEWRFGSRRLLLFARTDERARNLLALAPSWTPPSPPHPLTTSTINLIGWEQPLQRVKAGDLAHVAVTVQRDKLSAPQSLALSLENYPEVKAQDTIPAGTGPVRLTLTLPIPTTAQGRHSYILQIGDARTAVGRVQIFGGKSLIIQQEVHPQHPQTATFGQPPLARLLGYDLEGALVPGKTITLALYWQVTNSTTTPYKVFVHLIGADGRPAAQGDDFPLAGERPTTSWQPGEILIDSYQIQLPPSLPAGDYPLRIGFYEPTSGVRLSPVLDAAGHPQANDQLQLDVISVEP